MKRTRNRKSPNTTCNGDHASETLSTTSSLSEAVKKSCHGEISRLSERITEASEVSPNRLTKGSNRSNHQKPYVQPSPLTVQEHAMINEHSLLPVTSPYERDEVASTTSFEPEAAIETIEMARLELRRRCNARALFHKDLDTTKRRPSYATSAEKVHASASREREDCRAGPQYMKHIGFYMTEPEQIMIGNLLPTSSGLDIPVLATSAASYPSSLCYDTDERCSLRCYGDSDQSSPVTGFAITYHEIQEEPLC